MPDDVAITVNGFPERVPRGATIATVIERLREADPHLFVERNGRCVFPEQWATLAVAEGDVLELVHPDFGG